MLSCKDVTEKASSYIDKELPFFTRMQVKLHVFVCVNCQRYINQLQITIRTLGRMKKDVPVSEHVVDDIVSNLKQVNQNTGKHGQ
ncbi:zf-HC2 domain-containing protein [Kaarinaea lacus]